MLNANDAAKMTLETKSKQDIELNADLNIVLSVLHLDILKQAQNCTDDATVSYSWNVAQAGKGITTVFPGIKHGICTWDGGDGRSDVITPFGKLLKSTLERQGYEVYISSNGLRVSWRQALSSMQPTTPRQK